MTHAAAAPHQARALLAFIDESPSPWHAVAAAVARLQAAGFSELREGEAWRLAPGACHYVVRDGSLIAFRRGAAPLEVAGLRLIGAHTDSPGLRLKPRPQLAGDNCLRLGVEVYGGPLIASFADRELGLAGRIMLKSGAGMACRLWRSASLVRLPNLAIHMNREANESGIRFHKQNELPLLFAMGEGLEAGAFGDYLAAQLDVAAADILAWDLGVFDTQPGALWGAQEEFIAAGRIDNLASCHAALCALLAAPTGDATCVCALFDHEEVGSESASGAGGAFLAAVLGRLAGTGEERQRAYANSFFISADMAHAWNPNFPAAYEPGHRLLVNGGPAIKVNANQRYSTTAVTAARFAQLCEEAEVPCQRYAHRSDLGCGSTIGPQVAAALGVASVDVGAPMWAMHSARESAGTLDQAYTTAVFQRFFERDL